MRRIVLSLSWIAIAIFWFAFGFVATGPHHALAQVDKKESKAKAKQADEPQGRKQVDKKQQKREAAIRAAKAKLKEKGGDAKVDFQGLFKALKSLTGRRGGDAVKNAVEAVAPVAVDAGENAQVKQFIQQYGRQFQLVLKTELHFIRVVCAPTKQQFESISADGDKVMQRSLKLVAQAQNHRMRGGRRGNQQSAESDPRRMIADGLMKSIQANLSAEQTARYQKELDSRKAARKRLAKLNLVAKLDKDLLLTAEQRNSLEGEIEANWKESWTHLQLLMYLQHYMPNFTNLKVNPILTETQKKIWRVIPKQSNVFFGWHGLGMVQNVDLDEEVWEEEQPAAVQAETEKERPAKSDQPKEEQK